jgi:hypothetical protein
MKVGPDNTEVKTAYGTGPLEKMIIQRDCDGERHCFHAPLTEPNWLPATRDGHMRPDDTVMGVLVGDDAYAFPWWIMKNHHVANVLLKGAPIMVVLCEACAGASAFEGLVDGKRLTWRVEGKFNGTHILMDHETYSLWTPFDGMCLHGEHIGKSLKMLPLFQCTWSEWKRLYPGTVVPDGTGESRTGHGAIFPTPATVGSIPFARATLLRPDDRLPMHTLIFGVTVNGKSRAYPLKSLEQAAPVINDRLGDRNHVVFSKPGSWLAVAYDSMLDDRVLTFRARGGIQHAEDLETGSRWDFGGKAVAGPLTGERLRHIPSGLEKWFAWASAHPGADIFAPTNVQQRRGRKNT